MKLSGKIILLISPEPWGNNFVSKHHYAMELANRRNDLFFLNPPANKPFVRRLKNHLFIVDYRPGYRGLALMPSFLSARLIKIEINRIEKICNTEFDVIWNFDSSRFFNLSRMTSKLRINHCVDWSEDKNLKLINTTADICLATSEFIINRQKLYTRDAFNIGHGYALPPNQTQILLPKTKNSICVGYLGNLLIEYLDWGLIYNLINDNPDVTFCFAGPYTQSNLSKDCQKPILLNEIMNKPNACFLGSINSTQIHSFLSQMDALLVAYKINGHKEQLANPHKLLEYLASGKVVISTWTDEYNDKRHLLEMVEDNTHIPARFKEVINDLNYFNSIEKQQLRKEWALANTYKNKLERIETVLN